ncbi:MAG: D-glycero-beta-D-manno-heptose 1-phosphate adenylyltransferase [Syntrophobacteraceae bacterium]
MRARQKIKSHTEIKDFRDAVRNRGGKVVFTNGCFDLLHVGHVRYLEEARSLGDALIVAVNTDRSVSGIKGPKRPILPESDRAEVVASLECVTAVTLFDTPDPLPLIRYIVPDLLVKGADWPVDRIVGADEVIEAGGKVASIELVQDRSTTAIIARILETFSG